jgi:subtilisin family serine protease
VPAIPVPSAPVAVIGGGGATAAAIAGFGGSRQPIAPRFSRGQGQQPSSTVAALLNNKRHRAKELLIEVATGSSDQLKQALANQYGVEVHELGSIELINARIWHLTLVRGQNLATVLGQLLQDNRVVSAQPNYVYTPVQGASRGSSAAYSETVFPPASPVEALPTGGGVKVAIIDTCVDRNHAEIQGSLQSFFDATPSRSQACAAENHGTAVASLIGGHDQIRGFAPGAELMEARAFTETEEEKEVAATSREIALALNWAAQQGARVANLSFAGPSDPLVERAVAAAYTKGIVLVGAAGNAGPSSGPLYPAAYPEVIAVTAIDTKRALYSAANRGSHVAVSARGVDVIVAHVNNGYGTESGTSFAAATVSGIAAHLVKMRPRATPDEIRAALQGTAISPSGKGKDELFGYGLVNAKAATSFLEASVAQ